MCVAGSKTGEDCTQSNECAQGSTCSPFACDKGNALGESCGLCDAMTGFCDGTCVASLPKVGQPCKAACEGALVCLAGVCTAPLATVGASCDQSAKNCDLQKQLVCTSGDGGTRCEKIPGAPEPCVGDCWRSICNGGKCQSFKKEGDTCAAGDVCEPPFACIQGKCGVGPQAIDDPCAGRH